MGLITEKRLSGMLDIPVSLPAAELIQGDWLVLSTIKLVEPMKLTLRYLNLQIITSNVDVENIGTSNHIATNLGLVFVGLYRNYTSGFPGQIPSLEAVLGTGLGVFSRPVVPAFYTTPGVYSFIVANNMKSSSTSAIPVTTKITFTACVTGQIRLELDRR